MCVLHRCYWTNKLLPVFKKLVRTFTWMCLVLIAKRGEIVFVWEECVFPGGVDFALEIRMTCVGDYELNHPVYRNCI